MLNRPHEGRDSNCVEAPQESKLHPLQRMQLRLSFIIIFLKAHPARASEKERAPRLINRFVNYRK